MSDLKNNHYQFRKASLALGMLSDAGMMLDEVLKDVESHRLTSEGHEVRDELVDAWHDALAFYGKYEQLHNQLPVWEEGLK